MLACGTVQNVIDHSQTLMESVIVSADKLINLLLVHNEIELRNYSDAECLTCLLILVCLHR